MSKKYYHPLFISPSLYPLFRIASLKLLMNEVADISAAIMLKKYYNVQVSDIQLLFSPICVDCYPAIPLHYLM